MNEYIQKTYIHIHTSIPIYIFKQMHIIYVSLPLDALDSTEEGIKDDEEGC
jgi:hypothetical protein